MSYGILSLRILLGSSVAAHGKRTAAEEDTRKAD